MQECYELCPGEGVKYGQAKDGEAQREKKNIYIYIYIFIQRERERGIENN